MLCAMRWFGLVLAASVLLAGCRETSCGRFEYYEPEDRCICPGTAPMPIPPDDDGNCPGDFDSAMPDSSMLDGSISDGCEPAGDEVCDGEDNDCDGTIDGPAATLACPALDGARETVCTMGMCTPLCEVNRADCNRDSTDGCEAHTDTDIQHCGACDSPCGWSCLDGACEDATQISAGGASNCARLNTGRLVCWGANLNGELGIGSTTDQSVPMFLELEDVEEVAVGAEHACARLGDGTARCWGRNGDGRLGNGSRAPSLEPVVVRGPSGLSELIDITDIACGDLHSCAVISSGRVRCWGGNVVGQLGDDSTTDRTSSTVVLGIDDASAVAAGESHTCAIHGSDNRVSCWGNGFRGQLGHDSDEDSSIPVAVLGVGGTGLLTNVTAIDAGATHTCAVLDTGLVACWGQHRINGSTTGTQVPALLSVSDVTDVATGVAHSCVVADPPACWGSGDDGELGTGGTDDESLPAAIDGPAMAELSAGPSHTCGRTADGAPYCWGFGGRGRLGTGDEEDQVRPTPVSQPR